MLKKIGEGQARQERYRLEQRQAHPSVRPHTIRVPDGYDVAPAVVLVDVAALIAALGHKAIRSKYGATKLCGGAIQVKITSKPTKE